MRNTVCQLRKTVTCCPWTGYQAELSTVHPFGPLRVVSLCTPLSFPHFFLRCPHSILYTKTLGFDICISTPQTFHTALYCSFPSGIPWNLIPTSLAVFLPTYGCGPGTLPLLWYTLPSTHTIVLIFSLLPLVFLNRTPSFDTWAQILYGICNSTSYVISYWCHSNSFECPPFDIFCAVGRPHFYYIKRSFFVILIALGFFEPLALRVVFGIQKGPLQNGGGLCDIVRSWVL